MQRRTTVTPMSAFAFSHVFNGAFSNQSAGTSSVCSRFENKEKNAMELLQEMRSRRGGGCQATFSFGNRARRKGRGDWRQSLYSRSMNAGLVKHNFFQTPHWAYFFIFKKTVRRAIRPLPCSIQSSAYSNPGVERVDGDGGIVSFPTVTLSVRGPSAVCCTWV